MSKIRIVKMQNSLFDINQMYTAPNMGGLLLVCWVVCLFICLHANAILWIKSLCGLKPWYPQVLDWIGFYYYYNCVVICVLILNFNGLFAFTKRASFAQF